MLCIDTRCIRHRKLQRQLGCSDALKRYIFGEARRHGTSDGRVLAAKNAAFTALRVSLLIAKHGLVDVDHGRLRLGSDVCQI